MDAGVSGLGGELSLGIQGWGSRFLAFRGLGQFGVLNVRLDFVEFSKAGSGSFDKGHLVGEA